MNLRFENDVKTYGTQAAIIDLIFYSWFENDVKTYGTQATVFKAPTEDMFENDVKTYGTQAAIAVRIDSSGLRMM